MKKKNNQLLSWCATIFAAACGVVAFCMIFVVSIKTPLYIKESFTGLQVALGCSLNDHTIFNASDGDVMSISGGSSATLTNGTVLQLYSGRSCFVLYAGATLNMDATVTVTGADDNDQWTCGFYLPGDGPVAVNMDGTGFSTRFMFSAVWLPGTRIAITGDGACPVSDIPYWGAAPAPAENLSIGGGWWNVDPSAYLAEGARVRDYGAEHPGVPCRYRVYTPRSGFTVIFR